MARAISELSRTTLVLGAGASCELKLPTAEKLKKQIQSILDIHYQGHTPVKVDPMLDAALRTFAREAGKPYSYFQSLAHKIRDNIQLSHSIDNFLDSHQSCVDTVKVGKLAIAVAILAAEQKSLLFRKPNQSSALTSAELHNTWIVQYFRMLVEGQTLANIEHRLKATTFIVFNYDRCLEHFLRQAIQSYFGTTENFADELLSQVQIIHPYGTVGGFPGSGASRSVRFGEDVNVDALIEITKQLRTFTETETGDSSLVATARAAIAQSSRILFLGFGYNRMNMEFFCTRDSGISRKLTRVFGTTAGISVPDTAMIQQELSSNSCHSLDINFADMKCAEFFGHFRRSIAYK